MALTFFPSNRVKVFPCAYRGQYKIDNVPAGLYDPESRLNTEYNFINSSNDWKKSYLIEWTKEDSTGTTYLLKCVIGGYYFEISGCTENDFIDSSGNVYNLYIKTTEQVLRESNDKDSKRVTYILDSWDSTELSLDTDDEFRGIKLLSDVSGIVYTASLALFIKSGSNIILNYSAFLPNIFSGSGYTEVNNDKIPTAIQTYSNTASGSQSFAIGSGTTASGNYSHAEGYNTTAAGDQSHTEGHHTQTTSNGSHAHAEGFNTTVSGYGAHAEGNNTTAEGNYAHAEGYNTTTTTSGQYAHAEGNYTTASGYAAHAEGNYTTASHNYSHIGGNNTKSSAAYQTVIGTFNTDNSNALFIVGNGDNDTSRTNIVEVGKNFVTINQPTTIYNILTTAASQQVILKGNVDAQYGLDITGSSLTVGGTNFSVTTGGVLSTIGNATIATTGSVDLSVSGKMTTVKGNLTVVGSTTLNNKLTVGNSAHVAETIAEFLCKSSDGNALDVSIGSHEINNKKYCLSVTGGSDSNLYINGNIFTNGPFYFANSTITDNSTQLTITRGSDSITYNNSGNVSLPGNLTLNGSHNITLGNAQITYDSTGSSLTVTENLSVNGSIKSNNLSTTSTITAGGNITSNAEIACNALNVRAGGIEIKHTNNTPYIDFHNAKGSTDFDLRLIADANNDMLRLKKEDDSGYGDFTCEDINCSNINCSNIYCSNIKSGYKYANFKFFKNGTVPQTNDDEPTESKYLYFTWTRINSICTIRFKFDNNLPDDANYRFWLKDLLNIFGFTLVSGNGLYTTAIVTPATGTYGTWDSTAVGIGYANTWDSKTSLNPYCLIGTNGHEVKAITVEITCIIN